MATGFWANASMEPKRHFRFVLEFGPLEKYTITKVNRPSFEIGESEHKFINHTFYYPGRVTWNEVTFSMVDPVLPDNTGILMKMLNASGYRFPNDVNTATKTISKAEAVLSVGQCVIKVLGSGQGNQSSPIEEWTLKNPWIKSVNMGELDYGSDDILSMDVTLRYDWAKLVLPSAQIYRPDQAPDANSEVQAVDPAERLDLSQKNVYVDNFNLPE